MFGSHVYVVVRLVSSILDLGRVRRKRILRGWLNFNKILYVYRDPSGRPNQYVTAIQAVGEIIQVGLILMTLVIQIQV